MGFLQRYHLVIKRKITKISFNRVVDMAILVVDFKLHEICGSMIFKKVNI